MISTVPCPLTSSITILGKICDADIWNGNEGLTEMDMGKKSITQEVIWRGGGEWGTGTVPTGYAVSNSEPVSAFQEWCGFGGRRKEPGG